MSKSDYFVNKCGYTLLKEYVLDEIRTVTDDRLIEMGITQSREFRTFAIYDMNEPTYYHIKLHFLNGSMGYSTLTFHTAEDAEKWVIQNYPEAKPL